MPSSKRALVTVIDSHTGGEPTRVVVGGGPDLGRGPLAARLAELRERHDRFRSAVVNEPRGSDALVGAILLEPSEPASAAGVIFFNNVGYLGMCGHGMMGFVVTLAHLGRIGPGDHRIETPVGVVPVRLHESGEVSFENVPSYRQAKGVTVEVDGHGKVTGDVAWGGNWFFLVEEHGQEIELQNIDRLTDFTWRVRRALGRAGVTGRGGGEIDHIELFAPSRKPGVHARNFVLCPGKAYDRSPCGTGTSAKLAVLHAKGELEAGQWFVSESVLGTRFRARITQQVKVGELTAVVPEVEGSAWITGFPTFVLDPDDPCRFGL